MWNKDYSITMTSYCTKIFLIILLLATFTGPFLIETFISSREWQNIYPVSTHLKSTLLISMYACILPAFSILFALNNIISCIQRDQIFTKNNVKKLRLISWNCIIIGIICFIAAFFYLPFIIVSIAAAFIALIVRVIKNTFEQARALKIENDYTI